MIGFLLGVIVTWTKPQITTLLKQNRLLAIPTLFIILSYMGFLIISSTITEYDSIGDRLLSPIAVPITLLLLNVVESLYKQLKKNISMKPAVSFLMVGTILLLAYPARATILNITGQFNEGEGYTGAFGKKVRQSNTCANTIYPIARFTVMAMMLFTSFWMLM
jgi:hypothetical protein